MVFLLVITLLGGLTVAQPPKTLQRQSSNPFEENCLFNARVRFVDHFSPALAWDNETKYIPKTDGTEPTSYLFKESFVRSHQISTEIKTALNKAFAKRLDSHNKSYAPLRPLYIEEVASVRKHGRSSVLDEMPRDKLEEMLRLYQSQEELAETELIETLDEILTPEQFGDLAINYMTLDNLHVPLVAHYLNLSKDQLPKVKEACIARQKLGFELSGGFADIPSRNQASLTSARWHELNYRALSYLDATQFLKAARRLLKSWRTTQSFAARLEVLEKDEGLQARTELKVLGDFYREQAKLEGKATSGKQ